MENDIEFDKYVDEGAYHWSLAYHPNPLRRHLELRSLYEAVSDRLSDYIDVDSSTGLDIGCGDGAFLKSVSARGASITGVDRSRIGLSVGRKMLQDYDVDAEVVQGDVSSLPFDREFDFAVSIELIEHLPNPEELVLEANRCLIDGGLFVCTTPLKRKSGLRDQRHIREYTASEFEDILSSRFDNVKIYGYHPDWLIKWLQTPTEIEPIDRGVRGISRAGALFWNPYRYFSTTNPGPGWNQLIAVCQ